MTLQVAFLRAVNVGRRRVSMSRAAEVLGSAGFTGVWTYANSGNVVLEADGPRASIEARVAAALELEFGFEVTTFARTAGELRRLVSATPFPVDPSDTWFVTFLERPPGRATAHELEAMSNDFDTLVVRGADVHWRMRGSSMDTTIPSSAWRRALGERRSTSRNMNLLRRLTAKL